MDHDKEHQLERAVDDALRDLPLRRAPVELESRVQSELRRRAALPWWRLSFAHWPLFARCALLVVCCALVGLTLWDRPWDFSGLRHLTDVAARSFSWINPVMAAMMFAAGTTGVIERAIPATWIYVGLTMGIVLYAALFGLGAAAYRTLYVQPLNGR